MKFNTLTLSLLIASPLWASDYFSNTYIKNELKQFETNSAKFMNSLPKKKFKSKIKFKNLEIENNNFITSKVNLRDNITSQNYNKSSLDTPLDNDLAQNLVDNEILETNIYSIHEKNLTTSEVDKVPWTDDYWPIYKGILGNRYAIEEFDEIDQWENANNFVIQNPAQDIFDSKSMDSINKLSPGEKYDLLIGENNFYLTKHGWQQGKMYHERYNNVETWMGICHGWAPASYMLDRPTKKVTVKAFDGKTDITFYPSDIKALASLLWANTRSETRFVGGRCSDKNPKRDENGRLISNDCKDTNPATWHLSLINQVGISKRSFVMDATYDYEVWNHPIIGYRYKYFNPKTKEPTEEISEAIVSISEFNNDKFKKYRSHKTKKIIGIALEVTYAIEGAPIQRDEDQELYDFQNSAYYQYDLELDQENNIIGGEWYRNAHPDFLWTPPKDTRALTYGDYYLLGQPNWDGKQEISSQWSEMANVMAQRTGAPLAKIVESLIELSNK